MITCQILHESSVARFPTNKFARAHPDYWCISMECTWPFRINYTFVHPVNFSTADTCKNCAKCGTKCGKGFKIGTNEAYNIKTQIRIRAFRKFSAFVLTPIWLPQTKAFHWRRNSWKNFNLTSRNKCNHWKELTKLVQNDIDWMNRGWDIWAGKYAETADRAESASFWHLFAKFNIP